MSYQYNCGFGAVTQVTGDNSIVKKVVLDSLGRPTSVTDAFGTSLARTTTTSYDDTNRTVTTTSDLDTGSVYTTAVVHVDDRGRVPFGARLPCCRRRF